MYKLFMNKVPKLCNHNFTTIDKIYAYATRKPSRSNITFYLESLNLLDRIKSNVEVIHYGKKLVKIKKKHLQFFLKAV